MINKIGIDIVDGCHLKCIGCPNSTRNKPVEFMTPETLERCLSNINLKVNILRLYNFGEPLLHPQLSTMIDIVNRWGGAKITELSTSGQCDEKAIQHLSVSRIDTLIVSCDGEASADDYERIRVGADWSRLLSFLEEGRAATPKAKHIVRGIVKTRHARKKWKWIARGWICEFRDWHPFPRSAENPSGKVADKTKGTCRYIRKDNLYINHVGVAGPCCVYPDAMYIGHLVDEKVSSLVKKKKNLSKKMENERTGVCLECAF